MPRDGSGVYSLPAGTTASPNTTIESSKYNAFGADLVSDANAARPITAGGTGATSKQGAIDAIFDGTTTVNAPNLRVADASDNSKRVVLDASAITSGTTRSLTVPNASGTIDLINTAQTISAQKTFDVIPFMAGGGVRFPAAASLSADPNTLDDYEEGTYSPSVTASSGTITSVSGSTGVYQKVGAYVHFKSSVTITNSGTGAGLLRIGLPFTPNGSFPIYGRETAATGKQLQGEMSSGASFVSVAFYDNAFPGATGNTVLIAGFFTTAS